MAQIRGFVPEKVLEPTKCDHVNTHTHTEGAGKSAAWEHIHGVRLSSDHSILQIPAPNFTGGSDSAVRLLSTHWEDEDGVHPLVPSRSPHRLTRAHHTLHRELSACERATEAPPLFCTVAL